MSLKLQELQKIVKGVVKKEKSVELLREEISRVLGPQVLTSHGLERMAESANDRIDFLNATRQSYEEVRPSLLLKFIDSDSVEVRKLVAQLIPESFLKLLMKDPSSEVRSAVARRLPLHFLKEMVRRFPHDDNIRTFEKKRLAEAGVPTPKIADEHFDMYGNEPLGNSYKDVEHPGLTDAWYDTTALKIFSMYGRNVEEQWEEDSVHRYVDSAASMYVDVDRDKLLKKVYDLLDARDDKVVKESTLKELAASLRLADSEVMPIISEAIDPVAELLSEKLSSESYISRFEEVFSVDYKNSKNPSHARGICEGPEDVFHPTQALSPSRALRFVDEKALDSYTKAWNFRERDAQYRLAWTQSQDEINLVNFHLELK
ncbi:MAG: hypothetical protein FJZ60_01070 [Chlamydiae bacterium]|nr:hypothetical protein [Chlamydiota bacterium]